MQEKINQIIRYLLKEISEYGGVHGPNIEKLSRQLIKEGYTEPEIHQAVEWVITNLGEENLPADYPTPAAETPSLRYLTPEEQVFFSKEAYGYLIQLQSLRILDPLRVEHIIEYSVLGGLDKVDLENLKSITAQVLLGKEIGTFNTDAVYHPGNDRIN